MPTLTSITLQRIPYPRGRVLGGCSVINSLFYVRGNRRDFDNWEAMGNPGWSYDNVLHYFRKMEDFRDRKDPYTGKTSPPSQVCIPKTHSPMLLFTCRDRSLRFQTRFQRVVLISFSRSSLTPSLSPSSPPPLPFFFFLTSCHFEIDKRPKCKT